MLVVDDGARVRSLLRQELEEAGRAVVEAADGRAALGLAALPIDAVAAPRLAEAPKAAAYVRLAAPTRARAQACRAAAASVSAPVPRSASR